MRGIGYVRVSSVDQNPARQFQQLNKIGMDIIFEEKLSGATQERPELQKMFEVLNNWSRSKSICNVHFLITGACGRAPY